MNETRAYRLKSAARDIVWGARDFLARPTSGMRVLPDYLIIGAQRGGTTSLQDLIASHPDVRPPFLRKGIHYFDTGYHRGPAWYRSQFPYRRRGRRNLTGEASPYYLFHPLVPERIAALAPSVKIIALLRDPVERAVSHYKHEVRRGYEEADMATAFAQEELRLAGEEERMRTDPGYVSFAHQHFSYQARGLYADQLDRYRRHFAADQILALESEVFWTDPETTVERTYDFLGLRPWMPDEVPHLNATAASSVAGDVEQRLRERFAGPNQRLVAEHGLGTTWP